jgi:hypothetical protein
VAQSTIGGGGWWPPAPPVPTVPAPPVPTVPATQAGTETPTQPTGWPAPGAGMKTQTCSINTFEYI